MPDPRIERTKSHVLRTAREMIAARSGETLTFSRLAEVAQVSRRTLYTHWGTVERLIGEAITARTDEPEIVKDGLTDRQVLRKLLERTRDRLTDPITHVAISGLISQASQSAEAQATLAHLGTARVEDYAALIGPIDHEQYSRIVGPLYYTTLVLGERISDTLLDELVEQGLSVLGLSQD